MGTHLALSENEVLSTNTYFLLLHQTLLEKKKKATPVQSFMDTPPSSSATRVPGNMTSWARA